MVMGQANPNAAETVSTTHGRLEALTPTVWMRMATNTEKLLPSQINMTFRATQTILVLQRNGLKDRDI